MRDRDILPSGPHTSVPRQRVRVFPVSLRNSLGFIIYFFYLQASIFLFVRLLYGKPTTAPFFLHSQNLAPRIISRVIWSSTRTDHSTIDWRLFLADRVLCKFVCLLLQLYVRKFRVLDLGVGERLQIIFLRCHHAVKISFRMTIIH